MENMRLEITVNSASDLDGVRALGEPRVYVVVFVSNNQAAQQKTQIDETGKTNPTWNSTMSFSISESELHRNRNLCVVFQIHDRRTLGGDQCLGEVRVPLKDLFNIDKASSTNPKFVIYPVIRPNNSPKGLLLFSYRFHELASVTPNPQLQTQVYRKTVKYPQQQMPPQQYSVHELDSVTTNRQSYSMQNQRSYTPISNPQPNQYSMRPPQPTRYYNTISQQVPYQPNAQPPKSKSESYMKIGLMIGAGSLITGIGSLATNAVEIGMRKDQGGGAGDFGSGAVDPSTENRVENHNMGLDPIQGFQDPNAGLDSSVMFQDPYMGLDSDVGFQDSNIGSHSDVEFHDSNMGLDSGVWFQDAHMGLNSGVGFQDPHMILDSSIEFQDSNMGLDSGLWFQDPHMGLDSGVRLQDPNATFGFGDHPWVGDLNMALDQPPTIPDLSVLFVDQPFVSDTSSCVIPDCSGFIG